DALALEPLGGEVIALPTGGEAQVLIRERHPPRVAQLPLQRQALQAQRRGPLVVPDVPGDETSVAQRLGARRVRRFAARLERGIQPAPSLAEVPLQQPEQRQRPAQPQRQLRVARFTSRVGGFELAESLARSLPPPRSPVP